MSSGQLIRPTLVELMDDPPPRGHEQPCLERTTSRIGFEILEAPGDGDDELLRHVMRLGVGMACLDRDVVNEPPTGVEELLPPKANEPHATLAFPELSFHAPALFFNNQLRPVGAAMTKHSCMSTTNESGSANVTSDLDLHFLPAWAQRSSTENQYAKYEGGGRDRADDSRGDRPQRRDQWGSRPPRRDQNRDRRPDARPGGPAGPGPRREGGGRPGGFQAGAPRHDDRREERREPAPPPIQLNVNLLPEAKGVENLARQIRLTGRAYPLFDIGHLVLKKPERYDVQFRVIKDQEGKVAQPLFLCALDDSLWLSEQEAVNHVLGKHFATFYQAEKIPTDPPKGVYTFVAQCGMSGIILGPPNYHDYQSKLRKLHSERYSRMPFEAFKSRVKIVKEEAVVKKWIEEQSFRSEYTCLNVPETLKLASREEVERHFRETHLSNVIKQVESHTYTGPAAQTQPSRALANLVRHAWEDQRHFPLQLVTTLSNQFASHGLHFFKVNKNMTHVSVARPRYLDRDAIAVSEGVKRIVDFIAATPRCTRRKIMDALVSTPKAAPAIEAAPPSEGQPAPAPAAPVEPAMSPEATMVNSDLHWLVHEGHVIEFASGLIELAKKPLPKPPKPEPKKAQAPTPAAPAPETAPSDSAVVSPDTATESPAAPVELPATAQESIAAQEPAPVAEGSIQDAAPAPASPTVSPEASVEAAAPPNP